MRAEIIRKKMQKTVLKQGVQISVKGIRLAKPVPYRTTPSVVWICGVNSF